VLRTGWYVVLAHGQDPFVLDTRRHKQLYPLYARRVGRRTIERNNGKIGKIHYQGLPPSPARAESVKPGGASPRLRPPDDGRQKLPRAARECEYCGTPNDPADRACKVCGYLERRAGTQG